MLHSLCFFAGYFFCIVLLVGVCRPVFGKTEATEKKTDDVYNIQPVVAGNNTDNRKCTAYIAFVGSVSAVVYIGGYLGRAYICLRASAIDADVHGFCRAYNIGASLCYFYIFMTFLQ